jgi:hypothetical protein
MRPGYSTEYMHATHRRRSDKVRDRAAAPHPHAIDAHLGLRHALAIETNYLCLDFQAPDGTITRTIRAISPTEVELTTVLERPDRPPERIGEARLTRADLESPFRVRSRQVLAEQ